jgi:uncharacterized protein YndB with AHSA1/START domain
VFQALTDPRDLSAWHADVVRGKVEVGRTLELEWPKLGAALSLQVERVVPGRQVALSSPLGSLELSVVKGGIELCHTGPFDDDTLAGTESSWRVTLAILSTYLTRHVDQRRHVHWAMTRAQASVELCHAYFTDAHLLSTWLGTVDGPIGPATSLVGLTFANGRRARGPVLAHTEGRDVAIRWGEADDSVLVLRTLPAPDEPEFRYVLLGWSRWSELPDATQIALELDRAVARLGKRLEGIARA